MGGCRWRESDEGTQNYGGRRLICRYGGMVGAACVVDSECPGVRPQRRRPRQFSVQTDPADHAVAAVSLASRTRL